MRRTARRIAPAMIGAAVGGALLLGVGTPAFALETGVEANTGGEIALATVLPQSTTGLPTETPIAEPSSPATEVAPIETGVDPVPSDPVVTDHPATDPASTETTPAEDPTADPTESPVTGGVPDEPAVPSSTQSAVADVDGAIVPVEPGYSPGSKGPIGSKPQVPTVPGALGGQQQRPATDPQLATTGLDGDFAMTLSAGLVLAALGSSFLLRRRGADA